MDDNKDFSTPEQEVETKADSDADTKTENQTSDSEAGQNTDSSYDLDTFDDSLSKPQLKNAGEAADTALETAANPTVVKKKPFIQLPIIIAAALVLAVALGFFIFKGFFDTSLPGTWIFEQDLQSSESTEDEADGTKILNYFTFNDDGELTVTVGTISYIGTYSISNDEESNNKILTMYVPSVINGTFNMEVSGNIFTGRTLTLANTSSTDTKFELKSGKYTAPEIKRDGDFTPNEALIGKWTYDDGLYNLSFEFNKDGTATYTENKQIKFDGIYSYTDSTITLTYYTIQEATMEANYTISDDSIVINGITFTKDTGSTSDEG